MDIKLYEVMTVTMYCVTMYIVYYTIYCIVGFLAYVVVVYIVKIAREEGTI